MSAFWDQRFAEPGYKYGTQPNAWLQCEAHRFAPGSRVLVPGDGEGRNGVWLSEQGHRVQSVDSSSVGLAKARALAAERGVAIDTLCADLADWVPPAASVVALELKVMAEVSAMMVDAARLALSFKMPLVMVVAPV